MRLLEAHGIPYRVHRFSPQIHSAEGVASATGLPAGCVFKTLVVMSTSGGGALLALVPGDKELDLKALGRVAGEKKLRMATQREAEALTGLLVGGISALALLDKGFRVYVDDSALSWENILVSAGERGINLELSPASLVALTQAQVAAIARRADEGST